jgi:hypothetical protein
MNNLNVKDWLTIIGLSSLIATLVGHWLSSVREHRRWVYENKRLEWRELVDRFHTILHNIHYYRSGVRADILEDLNEGMLLLQNRLFIADTLERWKVTKEWGHLIQNTMEPKGVHTPFEIIHDSTEFEGFLLQIARLDLNAGWRKIFHKRPRAVKLTTVKSPPLDTSGGESEVPTV